MQRSKAKHRGEDPTQRLRLYFYEGSSRIHDRYLVVKPWALRWAPNKPTSTNMQRIMSSSQFQTEWSTGEPWALILYDTVGVTVSQEGLHSMPVCAEVVDWTDEGAQSESMDSPKIATLVQPIE